MIDRVKMSELDALVRNKNFSEVALGLTIKQVKIEASRCLDCKNPRCVTACPVNIDIPRFIKLILEEKYEDAYCTIYQDNILPAICGRVCPQEKQCEGACVLGIKYESVSIGALERFLGDFCLKNCVLTSEDIVENNQKVAIVGSGPAGIACAAAIRRLGYTTDVFEALHEYGGVLKYGIPEFRLPKSIVDEEIKRLENLGVNFHKNVIIGKTITIDQLFNDYQYKAIFIGSGAGLPSSLGIKGENLNGVYFANEFLTRVNLMKANNFPTSATPIKIGEKVAVVGGGNVAMDAARTAIRLGAKEVYIVYRRDMEALPARLEEIHHAIDEGVIFKLLLNPVEIIGEDYEIKAIKCQKMVLGELDSSNRRRPIPIDEFETIEVNNLIVAIGQSPNPIIKNATPDLTVDDWGRIIVDDYQTSIPGVFAGGDIVTGAATVILAMGAGKEAAKKIDKYVRTL
ncbi:MAG: NADPH-dependent glutamate synthase [Candidatus Izemoplasmatales bacterium]|jgi:glutamate synthase (NADPH/NADH) small chain|nr:NADPH-dependent glutamate synthase [Candidatus Izemoplasmatales bacterium]